MKPTIKKLWIKALRSGKYHQGRGYLRTRRGNYCCLGVLCDVYAKKHPKVKLKWHKGSDGTWLFQGASGSLPRLVSQWAGLGYTGDPVIQRDDHKSVSGVHANDTLRWNFKRIAKAIQENL